MYGLIIDHIGTYIRDKYGDDIWDKVKVAAGIGSAQFALDEVYSEEIPHKLIDATHDLTKDPIDSIMENIGYSFYRFLAKYEFHKIVRVLGRSFPEFLNGLDNLHEYLRFSFPQLKPPSFYCEHESRTGLTLHYRSRRHGFLHYVKGQIKNIGKELFQTEVEIELLDHENDQAMEHVIMRLHFNNMHFSKESWIMTSLTPELSEKICITSDIFFDTFPFIIVFNRGMRVRNVGVGLLRVMPNLVGKKINEEFLFMRPFIQFRWEEIMLHLNNIFEIMSTDPIWGEAEGKEKKADLEKLKEERAHLSLKEQERFLVLKGQMFYMEEWESICFMGIPDIQNLGQMFRSSLYINDLALHDSSRDLVLTSTQQLAELRLLMHQEAIKENNMKETLRQLQKERHRTKKLLTQRLPRIVTEAIEKGESTAKCCKVFESVTVLFTDVVSFSTIILSMNSVDVISLLSEIYDCIDGVISKHGLIKVETIGDTFMLVAGAPVKTPHHAEYALDGGLAVMGAMAKLELNDDNVKVKVRIGAHTGPVIATIIGERLPKYCIFGEAVSIAHNMEMRAKPMTFTVTEATVDAANATSNGGFKLLEPGRFEWKNRVYKTGVISGRKGAPRAPSPRQLNPGGNQEDLEASTSNVQAKANEVAMAQEELQHGKTIIYTPIKGTRFK